MRGAGGACKFLGMVFAFSLLVQGICTAETDTETNPDLDRTHAFEWILLLPIFIGSLLFLSWICRFFDRMNFCFVTFLLTVVLLWLLSSNLILGEVRQFLINLVISIIIIVVLYEAFNQRKGLRVKSFIANFALFALFLFLIFAFGVAFGFLSFNSILIGMPYFLIALLAILIRDTFLYKTYFLQKDNKNDSLIMNIQDISRNFIVIISVLIWPVIILYLYQNMAYNVTFYEVERLNFPIYIIAASYIGVISYLLLSVKEIFEQSIPEYKKMSIVWSYLRRVITAPFIAIIGFFMLNSLQNTNEFDEINDHFVFAFSFFAGFFTKTIEDRIYLWVQKYLPEGQKNEFDKRIEYCAKESDFVKKLGCDEDLACMLYNAKIRTIEELACCSAKELVNKVNVDTRNLGEGIGCPVKGNKDRFGSYSEQQIRMYINKAQKYLGVNNFDFVKKLKMDRDLAFKLYYVANIKTIEELKDCDAKEVHDKLCNCNNKGECEYSETKINKYKDEVEIK